MSFGDVIRSASSPATYPHGIGGNDSAIWFVDYSAVKIYEISTVDLSSIRNSSTPSSEPVGVGGSDIVIWYADNNTDLIYELSTTDFSVIRSGVSPDTRPYGVGGDVNVIWCTGYTLNKSYELSTTDFSVVQNASSPSTQPYGIGGNINVVWHCDIDSDKIYKLDPNDLSIIQSANSPYIIPIGIGGSTDAIWHCDYYDTIYELDVGSYTLSGTISDEWGNTLHNVDIIISNGATYTTTTDENGAYSQVVSPDTYNITASKSHSTFHDTSESIAISSNTTHNIIMETDKVINKYRTSGMSMIGGISLGRD